jgi:Arc/MetJ-type ribon-helix-helix transcriptional regulator
VKKELSQTVKNMAKQRLQVTVRKDLVSWMDTKISSGDYASRSHAIEKALIKLREMEEKRAS